jgi:Heterokaryon incompatibility protein (HET)
MEEARRSARSNNCDTCKMLYDLVEYFGVQEENEITVSAPTNPRDTLTVSIYADLDEDDVILDVFVPEGFDSGHPLIRSSPNVKKVCSSSGDDDSFVKIKGWLEECQTNHNNCNYEESTLPTRVIDVALEGNREPFLWETKGATGQYATLSYCWGKSPQLKTTKGTLGEFMEALPTRDISSAALSAIEICKELRIPYIWVDALCIIQDDEDDWLREVGKMCDVYSSSYLTIAAAATSDNTYGIFCDQYFGSEQRIASFPFRGKEVYARFSPFQDHLGHPLGLNFDDQFSDQLAEKSWLLRPSELPLVRRAWTVQERILSTRVIYFTGEEMWWECDTWWHCECGMADEEKHPGDDDHGCIRELSAVQEANRGSFDWLRDPNRKVPMTLDEAYKKWGQVITLFAAGNLAYANDKLPALSGLAHRFKAMLQERFNFEDTYLAGTWRRNFERQLLWVVSGHVPGVKLLTPRPQGTNIPTWSWMSTSGNVQFISDERDMDFKPRLRVLGVSTDLVSPDWAGRITGGRLVLEGFVVHNLRLSAVPDPWDYVANIKIPNSNSFALFNRDTSSNLGRGPYTCMYAADLSDAEGMIDKLDLETGNMFFVLKRSERIENAYERVGMGVAVLQFMTKGLWDEASRKTLTIV